MPIAVIDQDGKRHNATAIVEKVDRPKVDITLKDDTYINVSKENQKRASQEREAVLKLFAAAIDEPQFSLPLGAPASPLPKNEDDFGSLRTFNGKVESQHTGRDYPVNEGNSVRAIAAGRVVLADEHFLTGNSVYIDHGDGMVSASFHMTSLSVKAGDEVKRGQAIGKVGATGRTSGTHLHLGTAGSRRASIRSPARQPAATARGRREARGRRTQGRKSESRAEGIEPLDPARRRGLTRMAPAHDLRFDVNNERGNASTSRRCLTRT